MMIVDLLNKLPFWLVISLSGIATIFGDLLGKYWSQNHKSAFFWAAIAGYIVASFLFISTLSRQGLVIASILWSVVATVGFLVIGLIIFHEHLTGMQVVGVGFGMIGLLILTLS